MTRIPNRIKKEVCEFCGKFVVESKWVKSKYCDTEEDAMKDHDEKLKLFRKMLKENS